MEAMKSPGTGDTDTVSSHVGAGIEPRFTEKKPGLNQPLSHFSSPQVRIPSQLDLHREALSLALSLSLFELHSPISQSHKIIL